MLIVLLVYTLAGFFALPAVVRPVLVKRLSANLQREVSITAVAFNPYTLSLSIKGIIIKDKDSEIFASLDELHINIQASSLLKRAFVAKELSVKRPCLKIVRTGKTDFNFSDLIKNRNKDSTPVRFALNGIKIIEGSIYVQDNTEAIDHILSGITVSIPFLSNLPKYAGTEITSVFHAKLNGSALSIAGKSRPFAEIQQTILRIDIQKLYIPQYFNYLPVKEGIDAVSGNMDIKTVLSYSREKGNASPPTLKLSQLFLSLDSLVLKQGDGKEDLMSIPNLSLKDASVNLSEQIFYAGEFFIEGGTLFLRRLEDGSFNFSSLITPGRKSGKTKELKQAWHMNIKNLGVEGFKIRLEDRKTSSRPVQIALNNVNLQANDLTTQTGKKGRVSFSMQYNQTGMITGKGHVGLNPANIDLEVAVNGADILPLQPYIADRINLTVTRGVLTAEGHINVDSTGDEYPVYFKGNASLSDFTSVDPLIAYDFITWKSFSFSQIDIKFAPMLINVGEILLDDFHINLIVNDDGTLNLKAVLPQERKTLEQEIEDYDCPLPVIKIDTFKFENGHVTFLDKNIKPKFEGNLKDLKITISGLSSEAGKFSDFNLTGKLNNYAPLKIIGKIAPLPRKAYADLNLVLSDFDVISFTPYSRKYIGYTLQKGKLNLNLKYKVSENTLDGKNQIILDQLTLGEKTGNSGIISIPIKFALKFLKDREGKIHLDIPIKGDLNNPSFKPGKVILQSIRNLMEKIATSPLTVLGRMFGSGAELSYIEFDYGKYEIAPENIHKLETLKKAMYERPFLKLDVEGYADPEQDREKLKQIRFQELLKREKLKDMIKTNENEISLNTVEIKPEEYNKYLKKVYKTGTFDKPRNFLGMEKDLPAHEMEALLLNNIEITDANLRSLALKRVTTVRNYLLKGGKLTPERIFIMRPKIAVPWRHKYLKKSSVKFVLR